MSGLRILLLRATRLVRRAPVRSLTTGLLVTAAVMAGTLWLSTARGNYQADYSAESQFGQADVRYGLYPTGAESNEDGPVPPVPVGDQVDAVLAALPEGADTAVLESFENLRLGNSAIADPLIVTQGPWSDPLLGGMLDLADGRMPGPGEAVVPPDLAESSDLDLGDDLVILDPPAVLEVVGLGSTSGATAVLVAPGEFVASEPEMADLVGTAGPQGSASVLATLPAGVDPPQVPIGDSGGDGQIALPFTRDDLFDNAPTRTPTAIVVAVIAFVAVTAGAAFAIGAARAAGRWACSRPTARHRHSCGGPPAPRRWSCRSPPSRSAQVPPSPSRSCGCSCDCPAGTASGRSTSHRDGSRCSPSPRSPPRCWARSCSAGR